MDLLFPIKWVIELILVSFHTFFTFFGIAAESGLSWVLAIVGLVLVVRSALIPLFVKQIKSQRNMMLVQPELQKLQKQNTTANPERSLPKSRWIFTSEPVLTPSAHASQSWSKSLSSQAFSLF
jgi:YidC/Oxa1 family membrane protein insertase